MDTATNISRVERRKAQLIALFATITLDDITTAERAQIAINLGVDVRTIHRYFNGDVKKLPFAEQLLVEVKAYLPDIESRVITEDTKKVA